MKQLLLVVGFMCVYLAFGHAGEGLQKMTSEEFLAGLRYELSNRSFARQVTTCLAEKVNGDAKEFWSAYAKLERFSERIYQLEADRWGLATRITWITKFKASATCLMPESFHGWLLKETLSRTEDYVETLDRIRNSWPAETDHGFSNYMVEQERLQVLIMKMALDKRYAEAATEVDSFILKHSPNFFYK